MVKRTTGTQTVAENLAEVRKLEREFLRTPCVACGHAYSMHSLAMRGACMSRDYHTSPSYPLAPSKATFTDCRCRRFVDPVEVLVVGGSPESVERAAGCVTEETP